MTREDLIALAKKSGMRHDSAGFVTEFNLHSVELETLERFAALVAEKEREACALVCETHAPKGLQHGLSYASAIRAMKP